ncbi:MAG: hypothetical protein H7282_06845 [Cytophagaceae bacterium]|nr:hypothetical protein [Cytophagaceae bacterium]
MLLFLSIVFSMLLVLRTLNVFQTRFKTIPQRVHPLRRTGDVQDIDYEKLQ